MSCLGLASFFLLAALVSPLRADVSNCACDPARPETMTARECSLCLEADKQPDGQEFFYLKDISPRKPNRWLVLPRAHSAGGHHLHELDPATRTRFWKAAIAKARELWGDDWGLAYNSHKVRTQCHLHIHIGKLLKGLAPGRWVDVGGPDKIPVAADGSGLWVHPVGKKLRVHYGETTTETALLR